MKNTKRLVLILTGFIIGYTIASTLIKMPTLEEARGQAANKATMQLKKEIAEKEKNYRQKIDSLITKKGQLSNDLTTIKAQMTLVGNKYQRLKDQMQSINGKQSIVFPGTATRPYAVVSLLKNHNHVFPHITHDLCLHQPRLRPCIIARGDSRYHNFFWPQTPLTLNFSYLYFP